MREGDGPGAGAVPDGRRLLHPRLSADPRRAAPGGQRGRPGHLGQPARSARAQAVRRDEHVRAPRATRGARSSTRSSGATSAGNGRCARPTGSGGRCCPLRAGARRRPGGTGRRERKSFLRPATFLAAHHGRDDRLPQLHRSRGARPRLLLPERLPRLRACGSASGAAWLITWVRESFRRGALQHAATVAAGARLLVHAAVPADARTCGITHDRRGNYVAHDYAYNMLAAARAELVRVHQRRQRHVPALVHPGGRGLPQGRARREPEPAQHRLVHPPAARRGAQGADRPRRPDRSTQLGAGAVQDTTGRDHLHERVHGATTSCSRTARPTAGRSSRTSRSRSPTTWASTSTSRSRAWCYRVNPDTRGRTHRRRRRPEGDVRDRSSYRGLFLADGAWDSTVYKDENASTLSRNYAAAHLQLAFYYRRRGDMERAIAEMERVARMFPDFTDVHGPARQLLHRRRRHGEGAGALPAARRSSDPANAEAALLLRHACSSTRASVDEAHARVRARDPGSIPNYANAYLRARSTTLRRRGRSANAALAYLERWVRAHPERRPGARRCSRRSAADDSDCRRPDRGSGRRPCRTCPGRGRPWRRRTRWSPGAAGFIGSHLVERLLAEGVAVTGVDCFTDYYDPALKRANLERGARDLASSSCSSSISGAATSRRFPDVDVVFHQAAQAGVRASWGARVRGLHAPQRARHPAAARALPRTPARALRLRLVVVGVRRRRALSDPRGRCCRGRSRPTASPSSPPST